MKKDLDIVFLCGGYGSRMGELTQHKQKVLLPFHDKPILQHGLEAATAAFGRFHPIFAVAYLANQVKDTFGTHWQRDEIDYIPHPEGSEDRGVLQTVKNALRGGPFLLVHGNIVYSPDALKDTIELQEKNRELATLSIATKTDVSKHALVWVEEEKVTKAIIPEPTSDLISSVQKKGITTYTDQEELSLPTQGWLRDMGLNSFDEKIFDAIETHGESYMKHLFWVIASELVKGSTVNASLYTGDWYHVQSPEDLEQHETTYDTTSEV